MSYFDSVFKKRVNQFGDSVQKRELNKGIRDFSKSLIRDPNKTAIEIYRTDGSSSFSEATILTNKEDPNKLTKELHTKLDANIIPGNLINWIQYDNLWIVYQQKQKVLQNHLISLMVRCNYVIKWIDNYGQLNETSCYMVSSMDSKIKENFRTWKNMITPQPNKYMEFLIPYHNIDRGTKFLVNGEAWYVIEEDFSSVEGIMYLSLGETKVNPSRDDVEEDIANLVELNSWKIQYLSELQVSEDTIITLEPIVLHNGELENEKINIEVEGDITLELPFTIKTGSSGTGTVHMSLNSEPKVYKDVIINIGLPLNPESYFLRGPSRLHVARTANYRIINSSGEIITPIDASISDTSLASAKIQNQSVIVIANSDGKIGKVTLTINFGVESITQEIDITPLWLGGTTKP